MINVLFMTDNTDYGEHFRAYVEKHYAKAIQLVCIGQPVTPEGYDVYVISDAFVEQMDNLPEQQVVILADADAVDRNPAYPVIYTYQRVEDAVACIRSTYDAYQLMLEKKKQMREAEQFGRIIYDNIMQDGRAIAKTDEELKKEIETTEQRLTEQTQKLLTAEEKEYVRNYVFSAIRGYDVLDSLFADEDITEIMINNYDSIFIEKNGKTEKADVQFENADKLENIIRKMVSKAGREVNQSNPVVDTRLEDGSRVHVVLPPIALSGPNVTIRRFPKEAMTMQRLIDYGAITPEAVEVLRRLVKARYNIFISGGTGSGKTSFLNALTEFIPKDERIITIEDSAELQIEGVDNLVRLETRNANASGNGRITMQELIISSLRMRPDRIIVGEVRGEEALDMLQAMNTGHDGSISTGHANSVEDMLTRLETMVLQGNAGLPSDAIRKNIGSSIDIMVHLSRLRDHSRKCMQITEVVSYENGTFLLNPLYQFEEDLEHSTMSKVRGQLVRTKNAMIQSYKLALAGMNTEI